MGYFIFFILMICSWGAQAATGNKLSAPQASPAPLVEPLLIESGSTNLSHVTDGENVEARQVISGSTSMMVGSVAKATGGLLLVLVIIAAVAYVARRSGVVGLATQRQMVLRESLSIGAKERLVLVDFNGERLMLGVSAGQINLLKTSVPACAADEPGDPRLGASNSLDFQQKLNEFLLKGQR